MYYKLKLIHGPNLNMLGVRQPEIYGHDTLSDIEQLVVSEAKKKGFVADCFQSNSEGAIIDAIQSCYQACDGIILNAGAYTHYSYAIRDAIKAITIPVVEVHISDIEKREEFRHLSVTAPVCIAQIRGHGFESYTMGIDLLAGAKQ